MFELLATNKFKDSSPLRPQFLSPHVAEGKQSYLAPPIIKPKG